jgi:polysaccharide deacetylase family protein (PEP-CTERM system associated)
VSRGSFNQSLDKYRPVLENILTFEVEDRFHVDSPEIEPVEVRSRIIPLLLRLLDLLDEQKARATFFVLGWVARKFPEVVTLLDARGHEIASHGFSHVDVRTMSQKMFETELWRSKALLEEILHKPLNGFKAAAPCLGNDHLHYYRIIAEAGYRYDCSFLPENSRIESTRPFSVTTETGKSMWVIPQTTRRQLGVMIRIGENMRVLPGWFGLSSIRRLNDAGFAAMVNLKLWELDMHHPRSAGKELFRYSEYGNMSLAEEKLRRILEYFRFTNCSEFLKTTENQKPNNP